MSRVIPLFPLPLVLFPRAVQPLHIFEQRYRELLSDCLAGDKEFGVICRPSGVNEEDLEVGSVGCVAHVESTQPLGDGRSNIMVMGTDRFAFLGFAAADTLYRSARVEPVTDVPATPDVVEPLAREVRDVFLRAGRAARTMQDDGTPLPELPDDPSQLSFAVAQYVDLELAERQRLLSSRSAEERLRMLATTLAPLISNLERGADVHERARTNGHGHGPLTGDA